MRRWWIPLLIGCLIPCGGARAQWLTSYFPQGVPGYDTGPGVTVLSRTRPEYDPLGMHAGDALIKPVLAESLGYDDNLFGAPRARGAWEVATEPSVLTGLETSGGSLGAFLSARDVRYLGASAQDRTDGSGFLGGTIPLGQDKLTLGAGYLSGHEDRTALDAIPSDRPVAFQVADARAAYAASFGRVTVTPGIDLTRWRFDDTTILGVPVAQTTRDRTAVQGEVTLRDAWMPARDLLLVFRVLDTHYDVPAAGVASNNSVRWQVLAGADYDDNAVWRFRVLGGAEYSQAAVSRTDAVLEAEAIWSPSGLTNVTLNATRGIEDAAQTGLSSFTYTSAAVTLDHEVARDVLLSLSGTVRRADFTVSGGQQIGELVNAGATWLVRRGMRLSLTYGFTGVRDRHMPTGSVAGDYTRDLTLLTLRLGL